MKLLANLKQCELTTNKFLEFFPDSVFCTTHDGDKKTGMKNHASYNAEKFQTLNEQNNAIYFCVNHLDKKKMTKWEGRKEENTIELRAFYLDVDVPEGTEKSEIPEKKKVFFTALKNMNTPPQIVIETRNGCQPLWMIEPVRCNENANRLYKAVENSLVVWSSKHGSKADPVKDIPRVLRLPGFYHCKDPENKFLIKAYLLSNKKPYNFQDIVDEFYQPQIQAFNFPAGFNTTNDPNSPLTKLKELPFDDVALRVLHEKDGDTFTFDGKNFLRSNGKMIGAFMREGGTYICAGGSDWVREGNIWSFVQNNLIFSKDQVWDWFDHNYNIKRSDSLLSVSGQTEPTSDNKVTIKKITKYRNTDSGNAELFVDLYRDKLRYDHLKKRWLIWRGDRWHTDDDGTVTTMAIKAARIRQKMAVDMPSSNEEDEDRRKKFMAFAFSSENRTRINAMVEISKDLKPLANNGLNWDSNPWLLAVKNGVIDLKTGKLRSGEPSDRITMCSNVEFDESAKCPRWERFIDEIFDNNEKIIDFIHKAAGYSLTGITREQCAFFCFGSGRNGKSVFFEILQNLLKDYAHNAPTSLLEKKFHGDSSTNDIAGVKNKRLVITSEVLTSTKIDERRFKKLSAGEDMTGRFLYQENFTFNPHAKLWLAMNHRPQVDDDSYAFWRRVRLIPFNVKFSGKKDDKKLASKLQKELSGILNWLLAGCLKWEEEGLTPVPPEILAATKDYRGENDVLSDFIFDECIEDPEAKVRAIDFYSAYKEWALKRNFSGKDILTSTKFGTKASDKYNKKRTGEGIFYFGVGMKGSGIQRAL